MNRKHQRSVYKRTRLAVRAIAFLAAALALPVLASLWTEWIEYPANPVFDPANAAYRTYYPTAVYDAAAFSGHGPAAYYRMWFAQGGGIGGAYSNDGIVWTEINGSAPMSGLDADANHPFVVYDPSGFGGGNYFRIWYWDGGADLSSITAIRTARSTDGIVWTDDQPIQQHASDTALQLAAGYAPYNHYFYHLYGPGSVLYNPAGTNAGSSTPDDRSDDTPMTWRYVMYYDSSTEGFSPNGSVEQTSLAYSADGVYWIRYGDQPVLLPSGNTADWDGTYGYRACVLRIDGIYHMWYSGANSNSQIGTPYAHGIGHASSADGLSWTIDADNPALHVLDGVAWRATRTYTPAVLYDADRFSGRGDACPYKMWFSGLGGSNYTIGYAAVCPPAPADNPPVAVVDPPGAEGKVGASFTVEGIGSYDPDGDAITGYSWTITSRPPGSTFPLPPNTGPEFAFLPDAEGDYQVCLRAASRNAAGETVWSEPVCVTVQVRGYAYCDCPETALTVKRMEDRSWHMRYRVARLSWTASRPNAACLTGGFRIYRLQGTAWQALADVGSAASTYDDRGVADWYEYKVAPLREDGRECIGRMYDAMTRGPRWRR